jgi:hypothetical protein
LAKVGRNKIVIAGKEFLLTGTNGTLTNTLVFAYTVKINDTIDGKYFNINNRRSIFLYYHLKVQALLCQCYQAWQ